MAEGGLTDGEPYIFMFGNPTQSRGRFYEACFGRMRHRWHPVVVDARDSRFTNKDQIAEWLEDWGDDSDFFRVRVKGLPPRASDAQFIDQDRIAAAQQRKVEVLPDEPLVAGVDFAWGRDGFECRQVSLRSGRAQHPPCPRSGRVHARPPGDDHTARRRRHAQV